MILFVDTLNIEVESGDQKPPLCLLNQGRAKMNVYQINLSLGSANQAFVFMTPCCASLTAEALLLLNLNWELICSMYVQKSNPRKLLCSHVMQ